MNSTSTPKKPTLIFTPGMMHQSLCFSALRAELSEFETIAETLPSVFDPATVGDPETKPVQKASLSDDIKFIRERLILPVLDVGEDAVVVMHSYSGAPGSAAVQALDPISRKNAGHKSAVIGLVYIASGLVLEGERPADAFQRYVKRIPNIINWVESSEDHTYVYPNKTKAVEALYHDLPPSEAELAASQIWNGSTACVQEATPYAAWAHDEWKSRCYFVKMTEDRLTPLNLQEEFVKEMNDGGEVEAGHCGFVAKPAETAKLVRDAVGRLSCVGV